jgi:DNA-binding MarR family transcriptional regulator
VTSADFGMTQPSLSDYRALAAFRYEIRRFLAFSERAARAADIEPQQHQLLLAIQGLPEGREPTIGALAERLCVEHHTAVALVDKLEARALVRRERSTADKRKVLLALTPAGRKKLRALSRIHKQHLAEAGKPMLLALQTILGDLNASPPRTRAAASALTPRLTAEAAPKT